MSIPQFEDAIDASVDPQTRACMRLWGAVFYNGLMDTANEFRKQEPMHWFYSDERYPGSFAWLCDLFNIDVDMARGRARSRFRDLYWRKKREEKHEARSRAKVEAVVPDADGLPEVEHGIFVDDGTSDIAVPDQH